MLLLLLLRVGRRGGVCGDVPDAFVSSHFAFDESHGKKKENQPLKRAERIERSNVKRRKRRKTVVGFSSPPPRRRRRRRRRLGRVDVFSPPRSSRQKKATLNGISTNWTTYERGRKEVENRREKTQRKGNSKIQKLRLYDAPMPSTTTQKAKTAPPQQKRLVTAP